MTYEYMCEKCQKEFEVEQSIRAEACADCPMCGNTSTTRLVSQGVTFNLLGEGWASDGYSKHKK